jgi:hypothetical protein
MTSDGRGQGARWQQPAHEVDAAATILRQLLACGTRDATIGAVGQALACYWTWLRQADVDARSRLLARLRQAQEAGRTGPAAWVPVALGETDPALVHAAVRAWVGTGPVSVERLARATADAADWLRRGLALNRAAVFVALLERADEALLQRLAPVRGTLARDEALAVLAACDGLRDEHSRRFADEWRAALH